MQLNLLFFAAAREAAEGLSEARLAVESGLTVAGLRARLIEEWPRLERLLPRCRLAVNETFVDDAALLTEGDEVAVIPPVAGG